MINTQENQVIIGIYKITSPSGRVYIGQSINILEREKWYKYIYCKRQPKIYYSINKYGWEAHQFDIIEECLVEQLDEKENYWEIFYNSVEKGLNCNYWDKTPTRGKKHTQETKDKISKATKGKIRSKETKEKMSKSSKGFSKSKQHSKNISKATKGVKKQEGFGLKISKQVSQYDLEGNFIKTWDSITKASIELKINQPDISSCCIFKLNQAGGFQWVYGNNKQNINKFIKKIKATSVIQYDLENNIIKEWSSIKEATINLKLYDGDISKCCRGRQKTAGGFKWEYKK